MRNKYVIKNAEPRTQPIAVNKWNIWVQFVQRKNRTSQNYPHESSDSRPIGENNGGSRGIGFVQNCVEQRLC